MENKRKFDRNKVREGVSDWDDRGWTSGYWKMMQLWRQLSRRSLWRYVAWVCDIQLAQTTHKQDHKKSSNTPRRRGSNLFSSISLALVPASIRSSLVRTPMVRRPKSYYQCSELKKITITSTRTRTTHTSASPWGSTFLASWRASELVRSLVAGMTAKMRQFSLHTYCMIMSRIWYSMSLGWSPTGSLVMPGRSTRVRFSTGQHTQTHTSVWKRRKTSGHTR